jgi:hypothetical protein
LSCDRINIKASTSVRMLTHGGSALLMGTGRREHADRIAHRQTTKEEEKGAVHFSAPC